MLGFIISPAKTMNVLEGPPYVSSTPAFLSRTKELKSALQSMSYEELKALWATSDKLTAQNYERLREMDLGSDLTAAVIAYEGIQYQALAASVLDTDSLDYLEGHLRILSGFYGLLRPFDGVVPYRLEMQAKLTCAGATNLYDFWGDALAQELGRNFDVVVNLASVEYAKAVVPHAEAAGFKVLTVLFGERRGEKLVQRSTEAKKSRGTFVRWCAEHKLESTEDFYGFSERNYHFDAELSNESTLVFTRNV